MEGRHIDLKTQLALLTNDEHTKIETKYTTVYLTCGRELRTPNDIKRDLRVIMENEIFVTEITPYLMSRVNTLCNGKERR